PHPDHEPGHPEQVAEQDRDVVLPGVAEVGEAGSVDPVADPTADQPPDDREHDRAEHVEADQSLPDWALGGAYGDQLIHLCLGGPGCTTSRRAAAPWWPAQTGAAAGRSRRRTATPARPGRCRTCSRARRRTARRSGC